MPCGDLPHFFDGLWNKDFIISVLYMGIGSLCAGLPVHDLPLAHLPIAISTSTSTVSTVISILAGVLIPPRAFPLGGCGRCGADFGRRVWP